MTEHGKGYAIWTKRGIVVRIASTQHLSILLCQQRMGIAVADTIARLQHLRLLGGVTW